MAGENGRCNNGVGRCVWKARPAEGSSIEAIRRVILGMPACRQRGVALWIKAKPQFRGNFKRDAAAAHEFWRGGADLLAKLPKKPKRTPEQQLAADIILIDCRDAREQFLTAHAESDLSQAHQQSREFHARR